MCTGLAKHRKVRKHNTTKMLKKKSTKISLQRHRRLSYDNIESDLKETVCDEGDWIRLADKSHYWSFQQSPECRISGFRRVVKETFALLGCYAA